MFRKYCMFLSELMVHTEFHLVFFLRFLRNLDTIKNHNSYLNLTFDLNRPNSQKAYLNDFNNAGSLICFFMSSTW